MFFFFLDPDLSISSFYMQNARPPFATTVLEMRSKRICPSLRGQGEDAWWMRRCWENHQGLSYVPEVIRTKLINRHNDGGTLVLIQLINSMSEKLREIYNYRYQYLPIAEKTWVGLRMPIDWKDMSHVLDEIVYVYRLEVYQLRFNLHYIGWLRLVMTRAGLPMSTDWKDTSYNSTLVIINRLTKMIHSKPAQISWYTRAGRDNFSCCNLIPLSLRLSNQSSVVTLKFWSFLYCCLGVKQTTIQSLLLTGLRKYYATSWCRYQSMHLGLRRFLSPLTRGQQPRLSLHFQVLVLPVLFPSSIAVTANAFSTKKISAPV